MAIRYGMGRNTYANEDAAQLARTIWDDLADTHKRTLVDDARRITNPLIAQPWRWLTQPPTPEHPDTEGTP